MRDLSRLLRPRSIAVIGGGTWCENVVDQCRKIGFQGDIWPVHPERAEVSGMPAFASVADLPAAPDASFVGVNRLATIDIVAALSAKGAGGAICFASGFSEAAREIADASDLQERLCAAAGDMPIIGPNCYGLLNYLDRVAIWPDQHGGKPVSSGVAVITQSSNIAINLTMQRRALPLAYVVTAGNQAQTGLAELGLALLQDDRVTALGLHIEGVGDLRAFEDLAKTAQNLQKPIIALRVGQSIEAQAALVSHTASLAGTSAGAHALLNRLGIGEVSDLSCFLEVLKLVHVTGGVSSARVASLSCSGGEASLVADAGEAQGIAFPPLTEHQQQRLRDTLGPDVALANPLDYQTRIWGDVDVMADTFAAALDGDAAIGTVILDVPRADRCQPDAWLPVLDAAERASHQAGKPLAIVASLVETMPEEVAEDCLARGLIPLNGLPEAMTAIRVASKVMKAPTQRPLLRPGPAGAPTTLSEADAKAALAAFGLNVPENRVVNSPADAAQAAKTLGFPVALKAVGFAHKTEAGGVALNLATTEAVQQAASKMPSARFLVEGMVPDALVELLVGVTRDEAHGYVLTLAAGGTLTEILADSASLLIPAEENDVRAALDALRIAPLLNGYRGKPPADKTAIVAAIMAVQAFVEATHPLEVEINPLICSATGATVADALITLGDANV